MLKNKIMVLVCSLALAVGLVGCGGNSNQNNADNKETKTTEAPKEEDKNKPPINMDDVKLDIKPGSTDSKGNKYIDVTLTNNTKLPIKYCNITLLNKDTGEESYVTFANTIMPGKTSDKSSTYAPKSGKIEDVEVISYNMTLGEEDGKDINLKYDARLKQYQWKKAE